MLKHVGRLASTDAKVVVVYMQIPGKEDHSLIVESNSLPDRMHDAVMRAVESRPGQEALNVGEVFGRQILPDMGCDIMQGLHRAQKLRSVPVSDVHMVPAVGQSYPLIEILRSMGKNIETGTPVEVSIYGDPNQVKFNPHAYNSDVEESEQILNTARGIMAQAAAMQSDANMLNERAYAMAPSLRPVAMVPVSTKNTTAKKATKKPAKKTAKKTAKKAAA